jgi:FtsH-binding integral membrane protein
MLTAGSHTLGVTFTPTDSTDYTTATASVPLTVNKATPVITWPAPAPIVYGTALSATQLNARANVPGTFAYTPAAGTILPVGTNTLNLVFTPTDTADYTPANASVPLVVNPAPSFTLTASPSSLSIKQGNNASSAISVNPINGFTGTVSLSVSGLPKNVTATFSPNPTTKMSTVTFTASNGASLGSSLLTITGKSGSVVQTTTITLTVLHK